MKTLPLSCPSCRHQLQVRRLSCPDCETTVDGSYDLPALASLPREEQEFVLQFVKVGGSLKEMARIWKVSYPTVRNRLDHIIEALNHLDAKEEQSS